MHQLVARVVVLLLLVAFAGPPARARDVTSMPIRRDPAATPARPGDRLGTFVSAREVAVTAAGIRALEVASARGADREPLVQVSGDSPFDGCPDSGQFGTRYDGAEVEPWLEINPTDPLHLVGTWQQDRWSNGGARGLAVGVSFDGGASWQKVVLPGLTVCSGGPWLRASDPWVSFSPDGTLHHIALALSNNVSAILVHRSLDGGLTWSSPRTLIQNAQPFFNDKETLTADPHDPDLVYAVWVQLIFTQNRGQVLFSRSTDGGDTWSPARVLYNPGTRASAQGNQIVVLPDGTLLNFFNRISRQGAFSLAFRRSTNRGLSWGPGSGVFTVANLRLMQAVDPDRRTPVRDGAILFDVAVDPVSGALYVVWQEGGLTGFRYPAIAFSRSTDGGFTWTPPARVNLSPGSADVNRQAFTPSVHASASGRVGVSFYDFRFNDAAPGALTDRWFVSCHPEASDCGLLANWLRNETRVSEESFDIGQAPFANGLFLGDYVGLGAAGDEFSVLYVQPHGGDRASAFHRLINTGIGSAPRGVGWWKTSIHALLTGRGRESFTTTDLKLWLADIRGVHDLFDDVLLATDALEVLDPPRPASMRERATSHAMALLLNLAGLRLPPRAELTTGGTVIDAARAVVAVLDDPSATRFDHEAAKDLAESINEGRLLAD